MAKLPDSREESEDDPEVEIDPELSSSLFDDEGHLDDEDDSELEDEHIEEEEIDLDDLSAMEGPDA
jgi:hypothetical protein